MSEHGASAAGASGLFPETPRREVALRIYVELLARSPLKVDPAGAITPDPFTIAKLCYKLAEAFEGVEAGERAVAAAKQAKYDVKPDDMSSWMK